MISTVADTCSLSQSLRNQSILALPPAVWPSIEGAARSVRGEHELPEAIDAWIREGARVWAVPMDEPVFEIGSPSGLAAATAYWENRDR